MTPPAVHPTANEIVAELRESNAGRSECGSCYPIPYGWLKAAISAAESAARARALEEAARECEGIDQDAADSPEYICHELARRIRGLIGSDGVVSQ